MKVKLFLIGAAGVLSLGAITLSNTMLVASASPGRSNPPAVAASPSAEPSDTPDPSDTPESTPSPESSPGAHPCNHGFYVSQAAHAHKGGAYTSSIAQSDLGKNGDCSAPLPTPAASGGSQAGG